MLIYINYKEGGSIDQNKMEKSEGDKQRPKRDDNLIQVSSKRNANFYVYLGKKILESHETVELHALGNAVSLGVTAAENLVRNNYAQFISINTSTISMEDGSKKAKLVVKVKRHADFLENMKKFNEISEENKARELLENPTPKETVTKK